MSAQVTITQLPTAGAITGTELVPIVQNGQTVKTTTAALAGSPVQTQTFITKNQEPTLANSRALSNGTGVGLVDGGAQSTLQITLNAASGSLEAASNGMIAKTASNAVVARTMTSSTAGLSVTNGDGVAGAPAFALTGVALAVAGATGTGALALTSPTTVSTRTILGTANQIDVTDGNFVNSPVIAIASNPTVPGSGGIVLPAGTTGQRGASTNGTLRYNTTIGLMEGYINGAWATLSSGGSGVTSIATGTGLTGGPITTTGTISIDVTGVTAATYGSATTTPVVAVNAQGQITSATNTTITPAVGSITGLGTGVATALAVNVGSAGSPVVNGGALGTPSGGTLTFATGLPLTTGVTGNLPVNNLNSGTSASATTFWRGDGVWSTPSGAGDVSGPASATDNAIARFDLTTGKIIQNSSVTVSDTGAITAPVVGSMIPFYWSGPVNSANPALFPAASTSHGAIAHSHSDQKMYYAHSSTWYQLLDAGTAVTIAQGGTGQTTAGTAFNALSPITTTGDLIIGNGTNSATRLPIGLNTYILQSNGSTAVWAANTAATVDDVIALSIALG